MDSFGFLIFAVFVMFVSMLFGANLVYPLKGYQCTQSQIIDGKAECVEYRRTEK